MGVTRNQGYLEVYISFLDMIKYIKLEEIALTRRNFSSRESKDEAESDLRERILLQLENYRDKELRLRGIPEGGYLNELIKQYEKD